MMMQQQQQQAAAVHELGDIRDEITAWHRKATTDLQTVYKRLSQQIRVCEDQIHQQIDNSDDANNGNGSGGTNNASKSATGSIDWNRFLAQQQQQQQLQQLPAGLSTPERLNLAAFGAAEDGLTPGMSMASPPISHGVVPGSNSNGSNNNNLNYDMMIQDVQRERSRKTLSDAEAAAMRIRPSSDSRQSGYTATENKDGADGAAIGAAPTAPLPADFKSPCQVLVEFKRRRVLQFESPLYVAPGDYVVVGGDRGEDIGLVTFTWRNGQPSPAQTSVAKWAGVGLGKVMRIATVLEVSQLQGVQTELEARAVELAQEKVQEHMLPMRIVDAEYQFDRKKLTFYYRSQQRMDFRNLVKDLYKTFRARIWMEQD